MASKRPASVFHGRRHLEHWTRSSAMRSAHVVSASPAAKSGREYPLHLRSDVGMARDRTAAFLMGCRVDQESRSLSGRASPRAREPKMASRVTPCALIAGRYRVVLRYRPSECRQHHHGSTLAQSQWSAVLRRFAVPEAGVELVDQLLGGVRDHRNGGRSPLHRPCKRV